MLSGWWNEEKDLYGIEYLVRGGKSFGGAAGALGEVGDAGKIGFAGSTVCLTVSTADGAVELGADDLRWVCSHGWWGWLGSSATNVGLDGGKEDDASNEDNQDEKDGEDEPEWLLATKIFHR